MEIPASRWYRVIEKRRSRRRFELRPVGLKLLAHRNSICNDFRPFPDPRTVLVADSPETVFRGAIGTYGKIKGASAFVAFIGNMENPCIHEQVGYTGESIILEAEAMNLATCWVDWFSLEEVDDLSTTLDVFERVDEVILR